MALSGTLTTNTITAVGSKYPRSMVFSWTATQDTTNNKSTISWTLKAGTAGSSGTWVTFNDITLTINGTQAYRNTTKGTYKCYANQTISTGTVTIAHNDDGTLSVPVSMSAGIYVWAINATAEGTMVLDDIPRAATITAAPNFTDEDNPTITYTNKAGSSVDSLAVCITLDGDNDDIAYRTISKTGSSYTFSLTSAERAVLYNACTTGQSRSVGFYLRTIIGGNTFYSKVWRTLTIANAAPTVSISAVDTNSTTIALTGSSSKLIKYFSNVKVTGTATTKKGATISSYKITNSNKTINASSGTFSAVDNNTFRYYVTDSRGITSYALAALSMVSYVKLTCNLNVDMPDTDGNVSFTIKGNCFNGSFGASTNSITIQYRYKKDNGSYGSWTTVTPTYSGNTYTKTVSLTGLDYKSAYTFQARAVDSLMTKSSSEKTVKATPVFDWGEGDFKFNVPVYAGNYSLHAANRAISITMMLDCACSAGANYSSAYTNYCAYLNGNVLNIYFSATRSSAASGNITDEVMASFTITHNGYINNAFGTSFITNQLGACEVSNFDNDGETLTFDVKLTATAISSSYFSGYFNVPVVVNTNMYNYWG